MAMTAHIEGGCLVVPHGMTPLHLHGTTMYVEGWTDAGEFVQNQYDMYPLVNAIRIAIRYRRNDESRGTEDWYGDFGEPTKEARYDTGKLLDRDVVK